MNTAVRQRDFVRLRHKSGVFVFAVFYGEENGWAYVKPNGHKRVERVKLGELRTLKARRYGVR